MTATELIIYYGPLIIVGGIIKRKGYMENSDRAIKLCLIGLLIILFTVLAIRFYTASQEARRWWGVKVSELPPP
jgi:uncharacterized membrane protein HdeD (DUF308 family)